MRSDVISGDQRRAELDLLYADMPAEPDGSELELTHHFADGVYGRRQKVPAGRIVRLHVHGYDHLAVVAVGRGKLAMDDETRDVKEGDVVTVRKGVRHAYLAETDTIWICIHNEEKAQGVQGEVPRTARV